jgi:hypothetical protein
LDAADDIDEKPQCDGETDRKRDQSEFDGLGQA